MTPLRDATEGAVEFTDGIKIVPEWQRKWLKAEQRIIATTYADWVATVVNRDMELNIFREGVRSVARQHFTL